ncbi:uncharacterized protein LOC132040015 [Lycium ferocissimum]|uniref:uncharacterized protein LOC132040015 n=1 Tax=Lycium ferocissimum TaxID=112874 RepID=UPI002814F95A|nr:uncharacterized protein LOC132040015 [Lycium ferocissimum]
MGQAGLKVSRPSTCKASLVNTRDIADSVIYSRSAKELWASLEHRFGQSNGAKLCHLQKQLSTLVQGNTNVAGYFTKLKRLWDELDSLNANVKCSCVCICEGKDKLQKSLEDERLIQFLMGLNDIYSQARDSSSFMVRNQPHIRKTNTKECRTCFSSESETSRSKYWLSKNRKQQSEISPKQRKKI